MTDRDEIWRLSTIAAAAVREATEHPVYESSVICQQGHWFVTIGIAPRGWKPRILGEENTSEPVASAGA